MKFENNRVTEELERVKRQLAKVPRQEGIFIELMASDREVKASREGLK